MFFAFFMLSLTVFSYFHFLVRCKCSAMKKNLEIERIIARCRAKCISWKMPFFAVEDDKFLFLICQFVNFVARQKTQLFLAPRAQHWFSNIRFIRLEIPRMTKFKTKSKRFESSNAWPWTSFSAWKCKKWPKFAIFGESEKTKSIFLAWKLVFV